MQHTVEVSWTRKQQEPFIDNRYSRTHQWRFDGGMQLPVSASPQVVPLPYSDASLPDPEEAYIAAISSCHMLFFLSLAAAKKFTVEHYQDHAEGQMSPNEQGKMSVTTLNLRPSVLFAGSDIPSSEQIRALHEAAHQMCYLANSVKTTINIILS